MNKLLKQPVWIFYILVVYIFVQFSWWLYLIYDLNQKLFPAHLVKTKLMMVVGEGVVFLMILILGVLLIRRGLKREKQLLVIQENFLMSITHELKTPIASTKLNLQTLQRPDLPTDKNKEVLTNALSSVNRLDKLVNNLLLAKSLTNENYFSNKEPININQLLSDLLTFQFSAHADRITFENKNESIIVSDKHGLQSVLINIIDNALKYTEGEVEIGLSRNGQMTELYIIDNGKGIPDELLSEVTKKFFRIENEMTRSHKGTGLGLFLVSELAQKLDLEFVLENSKDKGLKAIIKFKNEE